MRSNKAGAVCAAIWPIVLVGAVRCAPETIRSAPVDADKSGLDDRATPGSVAAPEVIATSLTGIVDAAEGGDPVERIAAAIAAAPTGGIVYAGFPAGQGSDRTLKIDKPITLLLSTDIKLPSVIISANDVTVRCMNPRRGHGFIQGGATENFLQASGVRGMAIENCSFKGITGPAYTYSSNNAVRVTSCTEVQLRNNVFTGWQGDALQVLDSSDVEATGNVARWINGAVVRFRGVNRGRIGQNMARGTLLPVGVATIGIIVDGIEGTTFQNSKNIVVVANTVESYPNYQAITLHDCQHCVISSNTMTDVATGVALVRSSARDQVENISITGNVYAGTATRGQCAGCTNIGISITGNDPMTLVKHVVVSGNSIVGANAAMRVYGWGGIVSNHADDVSIGANSLYGNYGACVALSENATAHYVSGLHCHHVLRVDGAAVGVLISDGSVSGAVTGNRFDEMDYGVRAEGVAYGVAVGANSYVNVYERINGAANLTTAQIFEGTVTSSGKISSADGYQYRGLDGYTGTARAGSCTLTIRGGIITDVTGCDGAPGLR